MTSQKKLLIEFADILAIEITCCACGSSVEIPLNTARRFAPSCPNCAAEWFGMDERAPQPLQGFVDACRQVSRVIDRYKGKVGLRIEVKPPDCSTPSVSQT